MKRLNNSALTIKELQDVMVTDRDKLIRYSISKFRSTHNVEEIEEYPIGESTDEKPTNIEISGYSRGFLLMNLIEYTLAKQGIQVLEEYLKKSRIPQAKKYAKDIMTFLE